MMGKKTQLFFVENLTKRYNGHLAVDHLNFSIETGESFALLGPNGAGKTTTIKMLTGQLKPTEGTIFFKGNEIKENLAEAKRQIGLVPDTSNLYPELSCWENLMFSAQLYGVPKQEREKHGAELLQHFDLYNRRKDRFRNLSRGLQKRITIAAGLIHKPKILFLDEPTTGLDVQSARFIRKHLKNLHKQGTTLFLTTHYIQEADELCERIGFLNNGIIRALDHPDKLKAQVQENHILSLQFRESGEWGRELKNLPIVELVSKKGPIYTLHVTDTANAIPALVDFSKTHNLTIRALNTLTPTLEDAFVKITGSHPEQFVDSKQEGPRS